MRRISAPLLAADLLFRRTEGPAPSGQHPRRGTGGVSRFERRRRSLGTALSPSRRVARVRAHRRQGDTMLLPWLAVRGGRDHPRDTRRASSQYPQRPAISRAYPVHEYSGIVFAYMGPPDQQPPFPVYDSFVRPGYRLMPGQKYFYPCNWLQIMENAMDPAHTAFPHTIVSGAVFTNEFGVLPELEFVETPIGMIYIATRRVGDNVWARMVEAILPNLQQVAPIWEDGHDEHAFSGPMMSRW